MPAKFRGSYMPPSSAHMAGRSNETQPEAIQIIECVVEGVDLKLAAVARAGIDFADRKAAPKSRTGDAIEACGKLAQHGVIGRGSRFGKRPADKALEQKAAHQRSCPE